MASADPSFWSIKRLLPLSLWGERGRKRRPGSNYDDVAGDVEFSGCSSMNNSSSSPSLDDGMGQMYAWNALSPETDLATVDDGAQDLIESMLCDHTADLNPASGSTSKGDCHDKALRLLHLLMAAAEALSGWPQNNPELAQVILARLKQMVPHIGDGDNAATVSNMECLATHFADALQGLLGARQAHSHGLDVLTAFQMLEAMSPYIKFGHFTANQAILEAVAAGDRCVHVVDYDIAEGVQWASLMRAMADGVPPPPHLRITAVVSGRSRGGVRATQQAGRRMAAFAASVGQPFSFGQCRLDSDERFCPATVRVAKGETLVANCVVNHATAVRRRTGSSVASFLAGMATLGARVVTVVDDAVEACAGGGGFVARFMEELHRYSAVWDSLQAGFSTRSRVLGLVERAILVPNIAGAVSRAYNGGEAEERAAEWMCGNGFMAVPLSRFNRSQARLLLGLFNDGYTLEQMAPNRIVLGWKARSLLSASVWTPPPVSLPLSPKDGDGTFQPGRMSPASGGAVQHIEESDYIDSFLVLSPLLL